MVLSHIREHLAVQLHDELHDLREDLSSETVQNATGLGKIEALVTVLMSRTQIWVLVASIVGVSILIGCGIWLVWYSLEKHTLPPKPRRTGRSTSGGPAVDALLDPPGSPPNIE